MDLTWFFSLSFFKTKLIHSYWQGNRVNSPPDPSVRYLCQILPQLVISFPFFLPPHHPRPPAFNDLDNFLSLYCLVGSHFLFSWSWYIVFLSFEYLGKNNMIIEYTYLRMCNIFKLYLFNEPLNFNSNENCMINFAHQPKKWLRYN